MDYEKEYKEALERAKAGKPLDEVFPELKESEDERITAEIVDFISRNAERGDDIMKSEGWIAYLEKQKEYFFYNFQKSCDDCPKEIQAAIDKKFGIDGRDDNDNPLNGYGDWKKGMVLNGPAILGLVELGTELHKEQPAEWSEDYRGEDLRTRFAFYTYKDEYDVAIHEITDSIWYFEYQNCEAHFPPCLILISHVHELQHALRLVGIEHEITL